MTDDGVFDARIARTYDADDAEMFAPEVLGPTVDFLAELAGGRRALEFAVGTGRVALELSTRGVDVTGIELSRAVLPELRRSGPAVRVAPPLRVAGRVHLMARIAGLTLRERWSSWRRAPFTAESTWHVSVWDKTGPALV
jgi:hypothetical protein